MKSGAPYSDLENHFRESNRIMLTMTNVNPSVSIILATREAAPVITLCLNRLLNQSTRAEIQIIIANSSADETACIVRNTFPQALLIDLPNSVNLPRLRAVGLQQAKGDIVAFIDPYSLVAPDWVEQVLRAHQDHANVAIGGAVDLYKESEQGYLNWAQYFYEYGMFMSPVSDRKIEILPGSNITYKRQYLEHHGFMNNNEFWKTFVNDSIMSRGESLLLSSKIRIELNKPIDFYSFLISRFTHGRCYAGMRPMHAGYVERIFRACATPLLPVIFQFRWGKCILIKRRNSWNFYRTLPAQFLLFSCWSIGELIGYLSGPANSCQKINF